MDEAPIKVTLDLIERAKNEDEDACDRLVKILYPIVSATVFSHIRRSADHEDVIQEIFMKMFLKINQYKGPRPFEHWLSRVAVTSCFDWLRKRRARPLLSYSELSETEAEIVERTLSGNLAGDSTPQRELLDGLLDKLIGRLNPREQIVIRLRDLEERSVKEIEEITGWSPSKIKTLTMRARRNLTQHLQRLEGPHSP
jgi:RNA polymerase sigma-70 factor (ECF subfamily)